MPSINAGGCVKLRWLSAWLRRACTRTRQAFFTSTSKSQSKIFRLRRTAFGGESFRLRRPAFGGVEAKAFTYTSQSTGYTIVPLAWGPRDKEYPAKPRAHKPGLRPLLSDMAKLTAAYQVPVTLVDGLLRYPDQPRHIGEGNVFAALVQLGYCFEYQRLCNGSTLRRSALADTRLILSKLRRCECPPDPFRDRPRDTADFGIVQRY